MKRYNTPHRHRVIKTRLTEEEYAEFSERVTLCQMSQSEYIRQALIKSRMYDEAGCPHPWLDMELRRRLETKLIIKVMTFSVA